MEPSQASEFTAQLKDLEALEKFINKRVSELLKEKEKDPYRSEEIDQLCAALSKAQGDFPTIQTNRANNFLFNQYTDLDIIVHAVRKPLTENGLSVSFHEKLTDDRVILITTLMHDSAQYIETRTRIIPSKNDLQTYASALKAKKRHSFMNLLNITIQDDMDDDDGEHDMKEVRMQRAKGTGVTACYSAKQESFQTVSQHEVNEITYIIGDAHLDLGEKILETLKIESFADMPKSKYKDVKDQLRRVINAREGQK
jgi:hypothetical protein